MTHTPHILIVDDDTEIRTLLQTFLQKNDWHVSVADSAKTARDMLQTIRPDLIILDVMMPEETGFTFLEKYRQDNDTAVLILTAKTDLDDKVAGLLAGADDYLTKPFEPNELSARIHAILRRVHTETASQNLITIGHITYDCERGILYQGDTVEKLTTTESRILNLLCSNIGHAFSRQDISEHAQIQGDDRAVDVQITRLRKKIEPNPKIPKFLQTVWGEGYTLHI